MCAMRAVSRTSTAASEYDARLVERRAIEAVLDGDHVAFTMLVTVTTGACAR